MQIKTLESAIENRTTEPENTDKEQTKPVLTPEQTAIKDYINTTRKSEQEFRVNKAIQRAIEDKPPTKTPSVRKLIIWPTLANENNEHKVITEDQLRNKILRIEKRIDNLEDRFNYHIHLLDGLAHSI